MKHAFFIASALFAGTAHAASYTQSDKDEVCASWGGMAAKVMELRQTETPMSRVIELVDKDGKNPVVRHIIMEAYKQPAYEVKASQRREIDKFRNTIELQCQKAK